MLTRTHTIVALLLLTIGYEGAAVGSPPQPAHPSVSHDGVWHGVTRDSLDQMAGEAWVRPEVFQAFRLDAEALAGTLAGAPLERSDETSWSRAEIALPMPDGTYARFDFVEAPIMEPELAAKFPEIRTYLGQGIQDPMASVRFDWTPAGFHAQILSPSGAVYIDPYNRDDSALHVSYYKRDYQAITRDFCCELLRRVESPPSSGVGGATPRSGETLRTYRLACAATGEYTQYHGGTVSAGMAAITTTVNRVTGIYETELAIRMVLVANNDQIVYTNGGSDPYSNSDGVAMLSQNQSNIDSVIGSSNYDIGHVFSTGGGGVAYLGVVCVNGWKAQGVTGRSAPVGDPFDVDYVAHEMGHQFGGNHTFNGSNGSCSGGNRNGPTAYEPGSGSTIMAYAGICGSDDLQDHSDPYFHSESFDEIRYYVTVGDGDNCPATTSTGNTDPTVSAGANYTIPRSTPFTLTATGSDPDGDTPTYCWEERDLGPQAPLSASDDGSIPLFRSWSQTTDPSRTFPRLAELLNNTTPIGEQLPTTSRAMAFRVTARDEQAGGGGVDFDEMQVTVDSGSGPFAVTSPNNGSEVWSGAAAVTWNIAGTSGSPVNASQVNILLSTDGGYTYPITLAANTPNDGSESVVVPNAPTTTARVKVEGAGNVFFDISNNDFTVDEAGALAITLPSGAPEFIPPGAPTSFDVEIVELGENLVPGSPTLHHRYDGGTYLTSALTPLGGDLYEATLPAANCNDAPEFYISAEGDGGTTIYSPGDAPITVYSASVGTVATLADDNFETDQGWVPENLGASSGDWQRGVPVNDPDWDYDPASDSDGSGQC
ncbi:MAG: reprolysin-like metallopeptidase, partial [Planctomycetota bacterium]